MRGFYGWAMRSAAAILFGLALLLPTISLCTAMIALADLGQNDSFSPYARGGMHGPVWPLLLSVAASLQTAVWPFMASAVIWRFDRWLAASAKEAAE